MLRMVKNPSPTWTWYHKRIDPLPYLLLFYQKQGVGVDGREAKNGKTPKNNPYNITTYKYYLVHKNKNDTAKSSEVLLIKEGYQHPEVAKYINKNKLDLKFKNWRQKVKGSHRKI